MRSLWPAVVFSATICILFVSACDGFAQIGTNSGIPVVSIFTTTNTATWLGKAGVFTVIRSGNPTPALNVFYSISGTAINGVDYQGISGIVSLPSGVMSNSIVINPINRGQRTVETVVLDLRPPLVSNYFVGIPEATIHILPVASNNLPPTVNIGSPANGAVFRAPVSIPLAAHAGGAAFTNLEFFVGTTDLGPASLIIPSSPGRSGFIVGGAYLLNLINVPPGTYSLTAVATDTNGISIVSAPVNFTVQGTDTPLSVRITSPPNRAVFHGPANIPLIASATDLGGNVSTVEFFANSHSLGFGSYKPTNDWELVWTNPPPGTNVILTTKATSNGGVSKTSAPIEISIPQVLPPPTPASVRRSALAQ